MATKKKKKFIMLTLIAIIVGFFVRPIRANYVNESGGTEAGSGLKRTGLFSVELVRAPSWKGTIGLLGSSVTITRDDGQTVTWKAA